jgi:SAM-dependent methyltransferase
MPEQKWTKINFGGGRQVADGYCNVDIIQYVGSNGKKAVDIVMDVEKEPLPFEDESIEHIIADNVFEHLGDGFIFALNECHRVLQKGGKLTGVVPYANTVPDLMDITHKRKFIMESFGYIVGVGEAKPSRPYHPRYADYGVLPWFENEIKREGDIIRFSLSPRKVDESE